MTSNAAEQLNNAMREGRVSPIVELLKFIQGMMTRWFNARRKKSLKHRGGVPPEIDKVLTESVKNCKEGKVNVVMSWSCEVVGQFGQKHMVFLQDKKCSWRVYDKLKISCGHALMAADVFGLPYKSLVGDAFKPSTWAETYMGVITPPEEAGDYVLPAEVSSAFVAPPDTRKKAGRQKETRYPSVGEIPVSRVKKEKPNKCGCCRNPGHNRTSCPHPK